MLGFLLFVFFLYIAAQVVGYDLVFVALLLGVIFQLQKLINLYTNQKGE